jgi:leucyl aminopeptidase
MDAKNILNLLEEKNHNLPKISVKPSAKDADVICVPVIEGGEKDIQKFFPFLKKEKITGKKGERRWITNNNKNYYLPGIGAAKNINSRNMRRFYGSAYISLAGSAPKSIALFCPVEWIKEAALAVDVAALNPDMLKPKPKKDRAPEVVLFHPDFKSKKTDAEKSLKTGRTLAMGKNLMRILGALPPNVLNTETYAEVIMGLAKKWKVRCERKSKKDLKDYNLLNAVSAGSSHDSELLVLTIHPKKGETAEAAALVGKGLCYDSGGLQGKGQFMKFMKEDMAGSAAVLGVILNIVEGNLDVKETTYFLLPLAENMMGCSAMRADDIYIAGDGQAVEIIHTDAEGRLVLADTICYAKKNFKNIKRFYTIATLTGSCMVALGEHYTGVICNNEDLAKQIVALGKETGEYMHISPWDMDYDDNNVPSADVSNLGENDREAGWIKAGMFLYRFVPKAKKEKDQAQFSHFDIAGTIDMNEKGKAWRRKGFNSGIGVGLLTRLLTK